MVCGDTSGSVYVLVFECALKGGGGSLVLLGGSRPHSRKSQFQRYCGDFILESKNPSWEKIHDNWVLYLK